MHALTQILQSTIFQTTQKRLKFYSFLSRTVPELSLSLARESVFPVRVVKLDSTEVRPGPQVPEVQVRKNDNH